MNKIALFFTVLLVCGYYATAQLSPLEGLLLTGLALPAILGPINGGLGGFGGGLGGFGGGLGGFGGGFYPAPAYYPMQMPTIIHKRTIIGGKNDKYY